MKEKPKRIAIIGAGPAGSAAAIQLKRFGYQVLIFEQARIGGTLWNANLVENYLGFPAGITGPEFCERIGEHLELLKIDIVHKKVLLIDYIDNKYLISVDNWQYFADYCIIATGTKPIQSPLPIPDDCQSKVFYEVKYMNNISNSTIVVIGSGDAAYDYSLSLTECIDRNNQAVILHRSSNVNAIQSLIEKSNNINIISYKKNINLINIISKNEKLLLNCKIEAKEIEIIADFLLFAIGREPLLPRTTERASNSGNLKLIGDTVSAGIRQASIAAASGIEIAMMVHNNFWKKDENYR